MATPKKKTPTSSSGSKPARAAATEDKSASGKSAGRKNGAKAEPKEEPPPPPPPPKPRADLDADLIDQIRAELMRKKAELGANISTELDEMRDASEGHHLADMDDLGGDAHDEETAYKIIEIESAALDQIDYALDRMKAGTFGLCEQCEKPIAAERLKALPFANLCISCKRQQEADEE